MMELRNRNKKLGSLIFIDISWSLYTATGGLVGPSDLAYRQKPHSAFRLSLFGKPVLYKLKAWYVPRLRLAVTATAWIDAFDWLVNRPRGWIVSVCANRILSARKWWNTRWSALALQ